MIHLNFLSCLANPDVWMIPAKRSDGSDYYEYILMYTDATIFLSEIPSMSYNMNLDDTSH